MKKFVIILCVFGMAAAVADLAADRKNLRENMIRLHVVADSNSREDQRLKLLVKDAINGYLAESLAQAETVDEAKAVLIRDLDRLEQVARSVLAENGSTDPVCVTVGTEEFPQREYETFRLPSGIYETLRVTIGSGSGKNWWCVAFPALCTGTTTEAFQDLAVDAGLSEELTGTVSGEYEIRFFFLDCIGKLENLFHLG